MRWNGITKLDFTVAGLNELVEKVPPVVAKAHTEKAVYSLNWLSATGSGILLAALLAGLYMRYSFGDLLRKYWQTLNLVKFSLLTIAAMLALGFTTRYSGTDATLGLAFAYTGALYPFFGTMLGWLGVALTGSDTAVERAVRRTAENHLRAVGTQPDPDGLGQQLRRRHGQDDRRAEHRRRLAPRPAGMATRATSCATFSSTAWCWRPWSAC